MAKQQAKPAPKESPKPRAKQKPAPSGPGFLQFLISREQWIDWALIGGLSFAILIFLKIFYPYPQTVSDSGNYILSAATGKINGYRPYGYSAFLNFFHGFSSDVRFVVTWQWFLTFASVTFFLFSIKYMFRGLPKVAFYLLCIISIVNPSMIFMDAYMMSDSLFISLTLFFLTTTAWIIYNGSYTAVVANLLILWWCMDTRYIGLLYPAFSCVALAWAFWNRFKWAGLAATIIPVAMFFIYRSDATDKMKEEFGVETFSSFGGWQKANNAVAILPYVKVDENLITDPQVKTIHQIVQQFPDSFFKTVDIMEISFIWTRTYPGKACLSQYIQTTHTPYTQAWAYMGTQMEKYGDFLQSHYRSAYIKYYIMPNFINIFRVFDITERKEFDTDENMKSFFSVDRDHYAYKKEIFKPLTGIRSICDKFIWVLFFSSVLAGLIMFRRFGWSIEQKLIVAGFLSFIAVFCLASVVAAPIYNFRYMMTIYYCLLLMPALIIPALINMRQKPQSQS